MVAINPETGEREHGTVTSEARRIFENLKLLLECAGSSVDRIVQVHAMIYDRIEYDVLNGGLPAVCSEHAAGPHRDERAGRGRVQGHARCDRRGGSARGCDDACPPSDRPSQLGCGWIAAFRPASFAGHSGG